MSQDFSEKDQSLLAGVTLAAPPPVGHLHLELKPGVTALYGLNGVGKTKILTAVRELVAGLNPGYGAEDPFDYEVEQGAALGVPTLAAYVMGGVHLVSPLRADDWTDRWLPDVVDHLIDSELYNFGDSYTRNAQKEEACWWKLRQSVRGMSPKLDLSDEQIDYLLFNGRWMLSPGGSSARVFLCDPDTTRGPLAELWEKADDQWVALLDQSVGRGDSWRAGLSSPSFREWTFGRARFSLRGREVPALPPRPHVVGLQGWPDWAGFPVVELRRLEDFGRSVPLPRPVSETDEDPEITTVMRMRDHETVAASAWRTPIDDEDALPLSYEDLLVWAEKTANGILSALFDDPPVLHVRLRSTSDWVYGLLPFEWTADVRGQVSLPLAQLGAAHRRYCSFAIQQGLGSLHGGRSRLLPTVSTAFVDEPEAALHNLAIGRVAGGLRRLADVVLVASHSTEILQAADVRLHVESDADGFVTLEPVAADVRSSSLARVASRFGLSTPRLVEMVDVVLLVEGPHDEAVIREFLAPELARALVLMVPLYGTKDLTSVADSRLLFEATSAPFVLCLDSLSQSVEADLERLSTLLDGQRLTYFHGLRAEPRYSTPSMTKVLECIRVAIESDRLDRLVVHGFGKPDIVRYLDADLIKPGETASWEELEKRFLASRNPPASHFAAGMGHEFKRWIGPGYAVPGVAKAAAEQVKRWNDGLGVAFHRPEDFGRLADRILHLRQSRTAEGEGGQLE
jgi:hypothetical protein